MAMRQARSGKRATPRDARKRKPDHPRMLEKFGYALSGILAAARSERNFRIEFVLAIIALVLCAVLRVMLWGWVCVLILIGLVLFAELFNTAIEAVVDLASPEYHELAKRAKDIAAGAVLSLSIISVIAGLAIYIDAFMRLIGR
ncbi:MAG: diacylglycerol kinase family protein [Actinomycetota bacterium]|nr:diacylglycerol kinase family protein [Actinomycetota bacterium]